MGRCGATKVVKADVEPLVNFIVKFKVLVTNLLRRESFFQSFRLGRRPVLVRPANVQRVITTCYVQNNMTLQHS